MGFGGRGVVVLEGEAGGVVFGEEVVAEWGGGLMCIHLEVQLDEGHLYRVYRHVKIFTVSFQQCVCELCIT